MGTGGDCDDVDRDRDHGCDGVVVVMKMLTAEDVQAKDDDDVHTM